MGEGHIWQKCYSEGIISLCKCISNLEKVWCSSVVMVQGSTSCSPGTVMSSTPWGCSPHHSGTGSLPPHVYWCIPLYCHWEEERDGHNWLQKGVYNCMLILPCFIWVCNEHTNILLWNRAELEWKGLAMEKCLSRVPYMCIWGWEGVIIVVSVSASKADVVWLCCKISRPTSVLWLSVITWEWSHLLGSLLSTATRYILVSAHSYPMSIFVVCIKSSRRVDVDTVCLVNQKWLHL